MKTSIASAAKRFRPGIAPTLVVLLLLPLMVGLGFWQLSRGHEKQRLVDSYTEAARRIRSAVRNSPICLTRPFAVCGCADNSMPNTAFSR